MIFVYGAASVAPSSLRPIDPRLRCGLGIVRVSTSQQHPAIL
jgi:hypothetical protein